MIETKILKRTVASDPLARRTTDRTPTRTIRERLDKPTDNTNAHARLDPGLILPTAEPPRTYPPHDFCCRRLGVYYFCLTKTFCGVFGLSHQSQPVDRSRFADLRNVDADASETPSPNKKESFDMGTTAPSPDPRLASGTLTTTTSCLLSPSAPSLPPSRTHSNKNVSILPGMEKKRL